VANHGYPQAISRRVEARLGGGNRIPRAWMGDLAALLVFTTVSLAQSQSPPLSQLESQSPGQSTAPEPARITVPAGTRLALVLTHPVVSRSIRRGDEVYAQITDPVAVGNEVVIPAGSFVQGKMDKMVRDGDRGELQMQAASVLFSNGYAASLSGPLNIETSEGYLLADPGKGRVVGAFVAPAVGLAAGSLIGYAAGSSKTETLNGLSVDTGSKLKGAAIGGVVGLAAGGVISLVLITHSHHFAVGVGAPMEIVLQNPVSLDRSRIEDALRLARAHPAVPMQAVAPLPQPPPFSPADGICYTPGTPGTPATVIPGTPPIGDSPGTPATVIPGIPPTPGSSYPCSAP
jgi:hypothetical protein